MSMGPDPNNKYPMQGNRNLQFIKNTITRPNIIAGDYSYYDARNGDTIIGNDVWIGMEAMILPGVKIGDGAIIAARSVVSKDIEPYTIVGGNPARPIRKRFSEGIIDELLKLRWWDWNIETISRHIPSITGGDIAALKTIATA